MSDLTSTKPYCIAKRTVWEAYQQVKANRGAAGIDDETIAMFEQNLSKNLYKLWNRMSSGSYFPPPVKQVEIPKAKGGTRKLGIPTVSDRIAQTVVKLVIEPILDPMFHPDSYGYRPGRSAKQAIAVTRKRCWQYDWMVEFDIKAAFEQMPRERGTPQGGVVSPILMNLFMHYAFDAWMKRSNPQCQFARYADDAVVHCRSQKQAEDVMQSIALRLAECGLTMHPEKSKIVYCKDSNRTKSYPHVHFTFLGFTFQPRKALSKQNRLFTSFLPGVSADAMKRMRQTVRGWKLNRQTNVALAELAKQYNPIIQGWWNYYGAFYQKAMHGIFQHIDRTLERWARRKYKALSGRKRGSVQWLRKMKDVDPQLFLHWRVIRDTVG